MNKYSIGRCLIQEVKGELSFEDGISFYVCLNVDRKKAIDRERLKIQQTG